MSILFGYTKDNKRIHIRDYDFDIHGTVLCDQGHEVICKRGEKRLSHFCHKKLVDNCVGSKMSDWHLWHQSRIKDDYLEIPIGNNRADIRNADNVVIELQNSPISKEEIREREKAYGNMVWIFNAEKIDINITKQEERLLYFEILKGPMYAFDTKKQLFLDFGKNGLIEIIEHKKKKCVGKIWTLDEIDNYLFKDILKGDADKRLDRHKYKF